MPCPGWLYKLMGWSRPQPDNVSAQEEDVTAELLRAAMATEMSEKVFRRWDRQWCAPCTLDRQAQAEPYCTLVPVFQCYLYGVGCGVFDSAVEGSCCARHCVQEPLPLSQRDASCTSVTNDAMRACLRCARLVSARPEWLQHWCTQLPCLQVWHAQPAERGRRPPGEIRVDVR